MPANPVPLRRARRRSWRRVVAALALAAGATVASGPAALAGTDAGDDVVRRYDAVVELTPDGVAHVTLELDVDLGTDPNRGPYLSYLVKQRFDDTRDRVYRMRDITASSPTAPDEVHVSEESGWLAVRIGEEDRDDVVGEHTYRVTYTVEGLVNSAEAFDLADDQLYLNVVGDRWEIPLEDLRVEVRGPAAVTDTRCYTGTDDVCTSAEVVDGTAVFTHEALEAGEPWTVAVAFPAGTFGGVEPILQDRWAVERAFALTPVTGGVAAVATVLGLGAVVRRVRRRDTPADDVAPGLLTAAPRGPVPEPVRLTPPDGLRPGVVGTLVDERADTRDVTATLVDLAVRGYLTVGPAEDADGDDVAEDDWTLTRTDHDPDGAELLPFERTLLDGVLAGRRRVRLSALHQELAGTLTAVQAALYDDVTERGWFHAHPARTRVRWAGGGALLLALGISVTAVLATLTSWALVGLPLVVTGIAMLVTTRAVPVRTAAGSAVRAEAEAFRRHLATAEADGLRLDEDRDLFSRHLPWAIAFGLADRWARVVGDAAAAGRSVPEPSWYTGPVPFWAAGGLGTDVTRFTAAADSAVSAPAPGATGSSGFSGSVGGGVSGGGGGTW